MYISARFIQAFISFTTAQAILVEHDEENEGNVLLRSLNSSPRRSLQIYTIPNSIQIESRKRQGLPGPGLLKPRVQQQLYVVNKEELENPDFEP